jgi:hypothetical protein
LRCHRKPANKLALRRRPLDCAAQGVVHARSAKFRL